MLDTVRVRSLIVCSSCFFFSFFFVCPFPQIYSSDIHGGVLLQSPPLNDFDQREMFAFYLFPGDSQNMRVSLQPACTHLSIIVFAG